MAEKYLMSEDQARWFFSMVLDKPEDDIEVRAALAATLRHQTCASELFFWRCKVGPFSGEENRCEI